MKLIASALLLCVLGGSAPDATFSIRDFGAVGDGTNKDTVAFQKALDACAVSGGGEVLVPAGKYLIGSVQIGNRTVLRLETNSVIIGSADANDYPMMGVRWEGFTVTHGGNWATHPTYCTGFVIKNVTITGNCTNGISLANISGAQAGDVNPEPCSQRDGADAEPADAANGTRNSFRFATRPVWGVESCLHF